MKPTTVRRMRWIVTWLAVLPLLNLAVMADPEVATGDRLEQFLVMHDVRNALHTPVAGGCAGQAERAR